jgi:hypothetical protein
MVLVFIGISASVALADTAPTDPIVFTKGCGGIGKPACDAVILGPGQTTAVVPETFNTCDRFGNCTATDSVINDTGAAITSFSMVFQNSVVTSTGRKTLTYSCLEGGFFLCSPVVGTTNAFHFTASTGGSICSSDDYTRGEEGTVFFTPDDNADDNCFAGVTIGLNATAAENLRGVTLTNNTFSTAAPEPSSGLLVLFGLMGGLVSFKFLRSIQS